MTLPVPVLTKTICLFSLRRPCSAPFLKGTVSHTLTSPCTATLLQDIVVPFMAMSSHDRFLIETPLRPGAPQRERNLTFFFAGGICGSGRYNAVPPHCTYYKQQRYSGGVRQTVGYRVRGV